MVCLRQGLLKVFFFFKLIIDALGEGSVAVAEAAFQTCDLNFTFNSAKTNPLLPNVVFLCIIYITLSGGGHMNVHVVRFQIEKDFLVPSLLKRLIP